MGSNGTNAFLAHKERVGNDVSFVRGIIDSYTFVGFGTVKLYANERVTVSCGNMTFTNVEVVVLGINGWGIKPVPAVNDRVMLFTTQTPVPDIKTFSASGSMPPYDLSGLKALPVTDSKTAQLITVSKSKVELTGNNKVTIDDNGIKIEDRNGNKVTTSSSGVAFEDKNKNKITTSDSGVVFEDTNKNKVNTTTDGVAFEDKNHNKVTTTSSGISLEDANGSKHNKIATSNTGISITDISENTIVTAQSKITLTVKGGSVIEAGESSVKINSKLEIKK